MAQEYEKLDLNEKKKEVTKLWKTMKALFLNIQKFLKIKQKLLVN